jgi:hypothetical protein
MKRGGPALFFTFLVVASVVMTWPLGFGLNSFVADRGDPFFASWALAWDCHAMTTHPLGIFDANIFHPHRQALAYSEHMIGEAVMVLPLWFCGMSPVSLHNVSLLLSFPLSGFCMFLLARHLTRNDIAAMIAGTLFAFSSYRFGHMSNIPLLHMEGIPLFLLGLHRSVVRGLRRDFFLAAAGFALTALTCAYNAYMAVIAALVFVVWFVVHVRGRIAMSLVKRGLFTALLLGVVLAPFELPYFQIRSGGSFARQKKEIEVYAAKPSSYLAVPAGNRLLGEATERFRDHEAALFPGFVTLALCVCAMRRRRDEEAGERVRSLYVALALVAFWCSLGPTLRVAGHYKLMALYNLFFKLLPGFDAMRVPSRFGMIVSVAMSVLAAMGAAAVLERVRGGVGRAWTVAGVLVFCAVAEQWCAPMRFKEAGAIPDEADRWLAASAVPGAVVHLPVFDNTRAHYEAPRLLGSTAHWRPLVNGYSGFFPKDYAGYAAAFYKFPDEPAVRGMQAIGVRFVVVHWNFYTAAQRHEMMARVPAGAKVAAEFAEETVFEIAAR